MLRCRTGRCCCCSCPPRSPRCLIGLRQGADPLSAISRTTHCVCGEQTPCQQSAGRHTVCVESVVVERSAGRHMVCVESSAWRTLVENTCGCSGRSCERWDHVTARQVGACDGPDRWQLSQRRLSRLTVDAQMGTCTHTHTDTLWSGGSAGGGVILCPAEGRFSNGAQRNRERASTGFIGHLPPTPAAASQ